MCALCMGCYWLAINSKKKKPCVHGRARCVVLEHMRVHMHRDNAEVSPTVAPTGRDTVSWWNMTRLLPIRTHMSYCAAPCVPFASATAYDRDLSIFIREYTHFIRDLVRSWIGFPASTSRLIWTRRDLLLHGLADFDEVQEEGLAIMCQFTQQEGRNWCLHTNKHLTTLLQCSARTYSRAWQNLLGGMAVENHIDQFSIGLQNELVTTLHENLNVFDALFHANFVLWHDGQSRLLAVLTQDECVHMLLAFLMGMHPRLGANSVVQDLQTDAVCIILQPLLFDSRNVKESYGAQV